MDNKKHSIYALQDPITKKIMYIGKTTNLLNRFKFHCSDKNNKEKYAWIRSLKMKKLKPIMKVLDSNLSDVEALRIEREWITNYYNLDKSILNKVGIFSTEPYQENIIIRVNRVEKDRFKLYCESMNTTMSEYFTKYMRWYVKEYSK